ncbi:MAG: LTA synthase family protein [Flavobacteriales bacterium]
MKNHLRYWLKLTGTIVLFWLALFFFQRLLFVLVYFKLFTKITIVDTLSVFFYGLRLDFSTIGYLMLPIWCVVFFFSFLTSKPLRTALWVLFWVEVFFIILIHVAELGVYAEWRHKLSTRVFMHLSNPAEVSRTSGSVALLLAICYFLLEFGFAALFAKGVFKKIKHPGFETTPLTRILSLSSFSLLLSGFSILFMRGGVQQIPINIDAAYFSNHVAANDAAVNSAYYFGNSYFLFKKSDLPNHIPKTLGAADKKRVLDFYKHYPSDLTVIKPVATPNIVFIILEGWSANAMGCLTAGKSATPFFDSMTRQGILFTQLYAANTTSEIGNAAILSGFTGLPETALTLYPEKHRRITTLSDVFFNKGYHNTYLFSGDLRYGNIKGFLTEHHFSRLQDENDFNQALPKGKLNFYDEDLFTKFLGDLKKESTPFFSCVFTGSTHFPYDGPSMFNDFSGEEADYLNAIRYADHCLASFFAKAQQQSWYQNTLFVLVSDHGHNTPKASYPQDLSSYRIPCLFFGPLINSEYRGRKINKVGSQADIATTLLSQLSWPTEAFKYSRNLLSNNTRGGAFLSTIRGFGFVDDRGGYLFNFDQKRTLSSTYKNTADLASGKTLASACLYELFKYFETLE